MSAGKDASERIAGYYSHLFTFPPREAMIAAVVFLTVVGGLLAFSILNGVYAAPDGIVYGVIGLVLPLIASDLLVVPLFRNVAFLNPRRFTIMTFTSSIVYAAMLIVSSLLGAVYGRPEHLFRGVLMAAALSASLRHLSIRVFSVSDAWRNALAAFLQPVLCFYAACLNFQIDPWSLSLGAVAFVLMVGGVETLLWVMGRWDDGGSGIELVPLFRAFVLAWTGGPSGILEEEITRLGEERDLAVDILVFRDEGGVSQAALIVPYIHPGPFRDVGSSGLPQVLVERTGGALGCEAVAAHGVSTHERDLTDSRGMDRVAEKIIDDLPRTDATDLASPMVWAERDGAQASCQLFGDVALFTLSLSPKKYDDLPVEVADAIMEEAEMEGVTAMVIDSHNSIGFSGKLETVNVDSVIQSARVALRLAITQPRSPFEAAVARVIPGEWGLDEGMGPCGIASLVIRLETGQASAYVVVDGNNMVSGLRERVVGAVKEAGFDGAEVMTSDTHLVNALEATEQGYSPIGEETDGDRIIEYCMEAVGEAASRLRGSSAGHSRTVIPGMTVLGSKGLETLRHVLESGFSLLVRTGIVVASVCLTLATIITYVL